MSSAFTACSRVSLPNKRNVTCSGSSMAAVSRSESAADTSASFLYARAATGGTARYEHIGCSNQLDFRQLDIGCLSHAIIRSIGTVAVPTRRTAARSPSNGTIGARPAFGSLAGCGLPCWGGRA
jgi:hypothetical protein